MNLKAIVLLHLKGWSLYKDDHEVSTRDFDKGVWIGYKTKKANQKTGTTHFDVNIIGEVFYVLSIGVEFPQRGKGHGSSLYEVLEAIAKDAGCQRVQMLPSGQAHNGESRRSYLLRRGYREIGQEVAKDVA